jgi:glucans biosynthesis protein C
VRRWRNSLVAATTTFVMWLGSAGLMIAAGGAQAPLGIQIFPAVSFVLCCAAGSLCVLALVIRFANRRLPAFEILNENAYGMYLIHYVFVVWLQYALLGAPFAAVIKATIVFAGTLMMSLATVAAIRRIPAASRIIGVEARPASTTR